MRSRTGRGKKRVVVALGGTKDDARGAELAGAVARVLGTALALCILLVAARAAIVGVSSRLVWAMPRQAARLSIAAFYDCAFVATLTLLFIAVIVVVRSGLMRKLLTHAYACAAFATFLAALVNVKVVEILGRPLTYQWLHYSSVLDSTYALNTVLSLMSWQLALAMGLAAVFLLLAQLLAVRTLSFACQNATGRVLVVLALASAVVYFAGAGWYMATRSPFKDAWVQNPIFSVVRTAVAPESPALLTMATSFGTEDFAVRAVPNESGAPPVFPDREPVRNVLLFVMESVPAQYVDVYGSAFGATPVLARYAPHSVRFDNIYAHVPSTNKSLFSILCARYPMVSYLSVTGEHPDIPVPSLSSVLADRGFRTAFFNSSDLRFQNADAFLSHRQFGLIQDYRGRNCDRPVYVSSTNDWPFVDGTDEVCTAASLLDWIGDGRGQPFFAVLWTMMTHHPYFAPGTELDFDRRNPHFNRYLNALHHSDDVLGKILSTLEERGLADTTLVVVIGDHGEAFGQHGSYVHKTAYEEDLHVPCVLINRRLFAGEGRETVGGLIDVAPTILHVLGVPPPGGWQGESLYDVGRNPRVYFFSPWSDYLFGYREGDRKYIFNASKNRVEAYDLRADPLEKTALPAGLAEERTVVLQRLAAWVQYQRGLY
jgi:arylsulfatase A-like enzyme